MYIISEMIDTKNNLYPLTSNNNGTKTKAKEIKANIIARDFFIELKIFAKIIGALYINIVNKANKIKFIK